MGFTIVLATPIIPHACSQYSHDSFALMQWVEKCSEVCALGEIKTSQLTMVPNDPSISTIAFSYHRKPT
jgi:hypothetical protein